MNADARQEAQLAPGEAKRVVDILNATELGIRLYRCNREALTFPKQLGTKQPLQMATCPSCGQFAELVR